MKKLVCLVLLVMLAANAFAEAPGNRLGFEVLRAAYDGEQNQVLSPLSLSYALAMAAQGAAGETRQELLDALGIDDPAEMRLDIGALRCANAAFLTGDMLPKAEYEAALRDVFGAKWFSGEDATAEGINRWVEDVTDGMIPTMVDELPQDVQLALVNAIAMDAKWQVPFDTICNTEDLFHAPGDDVTVTYMNKEGHMNYGERDGVQFLKLRYRESNLELLIALPKQGELEKVLNGLCEEGLAYFRFEQNPVKVDLAMPKVDILVEQSMSDILKAQGIEIAFTDQADFSGITEDGPLWIDKVIQKARLILDEEGTRAAAATAVLMAGSAYMPEEPVDFRMDRPFAFVIADVQSGAVCFAGIVANPEGN